jgi:hypothetical protein
VNWLSLVFVLLLPVQKIGLKDFIPEIVMVRRQVELWLLSLCFLSTTML